MRKKRDEIWRDKWDQTILNEIDENGWNRWKKWE